MTVRSALEDLAGTTLAAVSGILGKLVYLASLRGAPGAPYAHWGLSRVHGEGASQEALAEAHRQLFLKILRTPLRALRDDMTVSSGASQRQPREYIEDLRGRLPSLLPQDLGGGSARHLSSVLHALSSLASPPAETPPGAIPPA